MAYKFFNPNPSSQRVGDCAVRAICKALGAEWEDVYVGLCSVGLIHNDMPSANYIWGMYLRKYGFEQKTVPTVCPACISVKEFADDHPKGRYILACQNHVVTTSDGDYFDTWDSGDEKVLYYYAKEI
jgi:hypothetical protein